MQTQLGPAFDAFVESLQEPSPVSVRYNPQKVPGMPGEPVPWCTTGKYLGQRPSFTLDPQFHAGAYYVQEPSSMLVEQAVRQSVDVNTPITALDLCAAPGGKSTHLISLLSADSLLICNEVIRSRASVLEENMEKWGYPNVMITQSDPEAFSRMRDFFDLILADTPCSGEGLFRKDPEAMTEWSTRNVDLCAARQKRILADVWPALRPGGVLIFSTCTYNSKENLDNLRWLKQNNDCTFVRVNLDPAWGVQEVTSEGCLGYQCYPHQVRGEGFFFSVVQKNGDGSRRVPRVKDRIQHPGKLDLDVVKNWIREPGEFLFFLHGQQIRALPRRREQDLMAALSHLHVLAAGTGLGEIKKNKIVPDHALALSVLRNREVLAGVEVTELQALDYLRMAPLQLETTAEGFHVLEHKGLGLGWVNVLPGRINSLFPFNRRIRMNSVP